MPPLACSSLPRRPRTPVAVRSSMPNSSASSSDSTIAAQLTATKGPRLRRLHWWICRATSSLPTPLSPSIRTVKSVRAIRSICWRTTCICGLEPCSRLPSRSASVAAGDAIAGGALDLGDDRADLTGRRDQGVPGLVLRGPGRPRHFEGERPAAARDLRHRQCRVEVGDDHARRALAEPHEGDAEMVADDLLEARPRRPHVAGRPGLRRTPRASLRPDPAPCPLPTPFPAAPRPA